MVKKKIVVITLAFYYILSLFPYACYPDIIWKKDFDLSLLRARSLKRPLMADFYTDWCGWCDKLDADSYSNARVTGLAERFICVKVDGDARKDITKRYGIKGYPTILFFDTSGDEIDRIVGYVPPDQLAAKMIEVLRKSSDHTSDLTRDSSRTVGGGNENKIKVRGEGAFPLSVFRCHRRSRA